ncbi:hypothetical protein MO867_00045 [Microbulbifer sp. OS29]|uniref:DUF4234 domain-containing protein n=1 Tax=Microbulbifer okhotskensis TaxID=2926617 RepID=A0A9X2J3X4_9GAMM|nr:hypothetical protein [Microbulbifer okhotskensis]MCO1332714.1 hypothetical protein [Microbulbifer okhotskensis]
MDSNIYSAPEADLDTTLEGESSFYVVSPIKFWVMSLGTMGLYSVYWIYRHWAEYRRASGEDMWPVMRAIFSIFFTHSLFSKIQSRLEETEIDYRWSPGLWATFYVIFTIVGSIVDRVSYYSDEISLVDMVSILLLLLTVWPLYQGQKAANMASGDVSGQINSRFTPWNFIWLAIGALLWGFVIFGAYFLLGV